MERLSTLMKSAVSYSRLRGLKTLQKRWVSSSPTLQYEWEPDLNLEPDIPEYETLNIKIHGYDFCVLDSFSKFVHRMAANLDINCERYAVPAKKMEISTLQFGRKTVTDTCKLDYYERVVQRFHFKKGSNFFKHKAHTQLENLQSTKLPTLLEMIWGNTPEGVNITLAKHTEEDEEFVYVPDHTKRKIEEMIEEVDFRRM